MTKQDLNLKTGDIFSIPIDDKRVGYGQIVATRNHDLLILIFAGIYQKSEKIDFKELVSSEKLLMGNTLDGKIYNDHWIIVGNETTNLNEIKLPVYKLGLPGRYKLIDYYGQEMPGHISDEIGYKLTYRNTASPAIFEDAVKSHHGIAEWDESDNKHLFKNFYESYKDIADMIEDD